MMDYIFRKLYVSRLCINSTPRFVLPNFGYVIGHSRNSNFSASLVETYVGLGLSISCKRIYSCRALHKGHNRRHTSHVEESCEGIKSDSAEANSSANVHTDGVRHILGNAGEDSKRTKGTNKTSHGNKGRVPWNKGRKHSEGNYFRSAAKREFVLIGFVRWPNFYDKLCRNS